MLNFVLFGAFVVRIPAGFRKRPWGTLALHRIPFDIRSSLFDILRFNRYTQERVN